MRAHEQKEAFHTAEEQPSGSVQAVDTSERQITEEALRISEDPYRILVENVREYGIFMMDPDRKITMWNIGAERLFGYSEEEAVGLSGDIIFTEEDQAAQAPEQEVGTAAHRGQADDDRWHVRKDGSLFWVNGVMTALHTPDGQLRGFAKVLRDNTERKQAEEELQASAQRTSFLAKLNDTLRPLADPIAIQAEAARLLGQHLRVSRVFYSEIQGDGDYVIVERDYADGVPSVAGRHHLDSFGPTLKEQFRAGHTLAIADVSEGRLTEAEREAYTAIAVQAFVGVPLVKEGRFVAMLGVHHTEPRAWTASDISLIEETAERVWAAVERARAEALLKMQTRIFNTTLSTITDFAYIFDREGRFAFVNQPLLDLWGLTLEQAVGKDFFELQYPEPLAARLQQQIEQVFQTGRGLTDETPYTSTIGKGGYYEYIFRPVLAEDGTVKMVAGSTRDITERKRAEEALRTSEERYRILLENVREYAIFMTDIDRRITTWNTGAERLLGYTEQEAVGMSADEVFTEKDRAAEAPQREADIAAREGQAMNEREHLRKDGSRFWGSGIMTALYGPDGARRGFAKVMRDDTERKKAEEELVRLNESLEERVKERTDQVRTLASTLTLAEQEERRRISQILHDDLQQLLYAVQFKLTFISQDAAAGALDKLKDRAAEADGWVAEAIKRTRQLTIDLSPPVLKGEGLADALFWLVTQMEDLHALKVEVDEEDSILIPNDGMRVLLFQIVRELLFNVVKHGHTNRAAVKLHRQNGDLVISIQDNGRGFDQDQIKKQGFGLFSIRERLDLFGGRLDIASAPGQGANVMISIPEDALKQSAS